ncbi:hypothetical protein MA16_Dca021435 [Dendrobium catenatum]|uniref:Uncharacterized protein n=1 Tax=Dendrobium catenatum TaxID=906689 RepID=A0A2I0WE48_9ASPA|nr:hypothetical protein MA16_Dca021435 [Dendrobium catenatum]
MKKASTITDVLPILQNRLKLLEDNSANEVSVMSTLAESVLEEGEIDKEDGAGNKGIVAPSNSDNKAEEDPQNLGILFLDKTCSRTKKLKLLKELKHLGSLNNSSRKKSEVFGEQNLMEGEFDQGDIMEGPTDKSCKQLISKIGDDNKACNSKENYEEGTIVRSAWTIKPILNCLVCIQGDALANLLRFVLIGQDDIHIGLDDIVGNLQLMSSFEALLFKSPCHKRKSNLALGHLIAYILETKYQIQYPVPPNLPTLFSSNNSFSTLQSTRLHPGDEEPRRAEEEEAPAPTPVLDPVPLHLHSPFDQLIERFDRWETRFDDYVAAQEQQYSEDIARYEQHRKEDLAHFDIYITHQQQQHDQDIAWFNAQFTILASYFQQPPPPPPSHDQGPSFF